jgi:hypothetical protein
MNDLFIIQTKDGPTAKWRTVRFQKPVTRDHAERLAAELDEHGNCVRVVPYVRPPWPKRASMLRAR